MEFLKKAAGTAISILIGILIAILIKLLGFHFVMMGGLILIGVIFVLVCLVFIPSTIMSYKHIKILGEITIAACEESCPPEMSNNWANQNSFNYLGKFESHIGSANVLIYAWQHLERSSFFCQYDFTIPCKDQETQSEDKVNTSYDFITNFNHGFGLTTGSNLGCQFLPKRLKSYVQSFSDLDLNGMWEKHYHAEKLLLDIGGVILNRTKQSFESFKEELYETLLEQAEYIHSLPLWQLRCGCWYIIRREKWHNKSIQTQYEKGMIKLPKELSGIGDLS